MFAINSLASSNARQRKQIAMNQQAKVAIILATVEVLGGEYSLAAIVDIGFASRGEINQVSRITFKITDVRPR